MGEFDFIEFSKIEFDCPVNSLAEIKEQRMMLELKYERLLLIQNNQQSARNREEAKGILINMSEHLWSISKHMCNFGDLRLFSTSVYRKYLELFFCDLFLSANNERRMEDKPRGGGSETSKAKGSIFSLILAE